MSTNKFLKKWQSKNKFSAVKTRCRQGHAHPSKGEAEYCDQLHLKLRATNCTWEGIEYEREYPLEVNGKLICVHRPDWTITHSDQEYRHSVIEFKGTETRDWQLKRKLFMAIYPNIPYTVVKRR